MEEYISKEEVKGFVRSGISTDTEADKEYVCAFIDSIPPADVRPIIHGHWEEDGHGHIICKACKEANVSTWKSRFCPMCGADMRGE